MRSWLYSFAVLTVMTAPSTAAAQVQYPPGTFSVDGFPVVCGNVTFVVNPYLQDVGRASPGYIELNPNVFSYLNTSLKLFWVGHECGHHVVGYSESAADCWAIRTGRDQGWFPPEAFWGMIEMFRNNPGSMVHPPGPVRVRQMMTCYRSF